MSPADDMAARSLAVLAANLFEAMLLADAKGRLLLAGGPVFEYTGLSPEQLLTGYGDLYTVSSPEEPDIPLHEMPLARALRGEVINQVTLTFHTPERDATILVNAAPVRDASSDILGAILVFQDISRRSSSERRTHLLNELSELLSDGRLDRLQFSRIAARVGEVMGAWAVIGLTHLPDEELEVVATYHPDQARAAELDALANDVSIPIGIDPGMGWVAARGRPILLPRVPSLYTLPNLDVRVRELFPRLGSESILIVPLTARGNSLGALMLVSLPHNPRFTAEDLEYCSQLVDRIAATLDNVKLLNDLRRNEWRMRMLAELSRQFGVSLDLQQVLRTVAVQVAEALGDWCTIGLLDDHGQLIRPAAVHHRDISKSPALHRLAEGAPVPVGEGLTGRVVSTQQSVLLEESTELDLRWNVRDREAARPFQPSAYICVPLTVRSRPLGYLEVACAPESGRRLGSSELELMEDLADRAASAIQNAQLYEELQAVIRAKDDWLSVASHELKTPLTPLQILLQLMIRRVRRSEGVSIDQLDKCLAQVHKLIDLINNLLDVSKVELGQLELVHEALPLRNLVEDVVNGFKETSELHDIVLNPGGEGLTISGDRARLEQVLVNLIHNAIKYSPEGGKVTIDMRREEIEGYPRAIITVEDQGIGIPEEDQSRLFQRYFRASNVPERNFGGLGLGLWISAEIVRRHNGLLWADSQAGSGSRFYVSLPLLEENAPPLEKKGPVVLMVDDDEAILEAASDCLQEEGYQVLLARNGQSAMSILAGVRPDVVMMDLMMPLMDGWELMRRIRSLPEGYEIRVIVVSATHDLAARAQEMGAFDYLAKPFSLEEMLKKIARSLPTKDEA